MKQFISLISISLLIIASITTIPQYGFASKDGNDNDEDDKDERKLAEAMDMIDDIETTYDLVEMCQYMKDSGHYKESTNCLNWAMDETIDHKKIIKNFAILKGYGLYD